MLHQHIDKLNPQPIPQQESGTQGKSQTASPAQTTETSAQLPRNSASQATTYPIDWKEKGEARLVEIKKFYDKYAGRVGCNPYFYYGKYIKPLEYTLAKFDSLFEFYVPLLNEEGQPVLDAEKLPTLKAVAKEHYIQWLWNNIQSLEMKEAYALHDRDAFDAENLRVKTVADDKKSGRKQIIVQ